MDLIGDSMIVKRRTDGDGHISIIAAFPENAAERFALLCSCEDSEGWKRLSLKSHGCRISQRAALGVISVLCTLCTERSS